MKKILLINNGYPSEQDRQYTAYIESIKECLERSGQTVDLLVMYADFGDSKILKILSYIKYYIKLFFFRNYKKYDYVYINNYPHSFLPLIFRLKFMNNLIIHWHGADIYAENLFGRILNKLSYIFIPKNCKHITPSKYFADSVADTLGIEKESVVISPSGGVDTDKFYPVFRDKKGFHIGFASNVSKGKGFDMFYRMINDVKKIEKRFGVKLYFHYINYGKEKSYYFNKLKNNSKVFIHNIYPKDNMPSFYSEILLLLLSTRRAESLGLVSLEAMSCGVPVVGTDSFAMKEYIVERVSGERFEFSNYDSMLSAVEKLIKDYRSYKPRDFITKNYSMKSVITGYKEYFKYE